MRQTVKEAGGAVLTFDGINEGDKDFRALLTRIRAAKPEVLFFGGIYNEAGLLAKQANELGIKATFLAADGSFGQKFIDIAGAEAAEGAVMTFIAPDEQTSETMRASKSRARCEWSLGLTLRAAGGTMPVWIAELFELLRHGTGKWV